MTAIQQPTRDVAGPGVAGTGLITGVIVTDDASARPVRRALVTISGTGRGSGSTVVTDDAGRFTFGALPAGRYTLSAARPSYLNASYGATRPGRPGTPIQLADGQRMTAVTIKMARGGVITGTIVDQNNEPLSSVRVALMRYVYSSQNGERTLQASGGSGTTDDRGTYRIFGITPGDYLVQLSPPFAMPGDLRQTTDQSMQAAMQQLRSTTTSTPTGASAAPVPQGPTVGYSPVYYPGVTSAASATAVKIAAGDERTGIDIQFQMVPTAKIEGVVVGPDGQPAPTAQISVLGATQADMMSSIMASMFGANRPSADGRFTLSGIAPGQYTIAARTSTAGAGRIGGGGAGAPPMLTRSAGDLWATADVTVAGQDVSGVRLALEPGMAVSGRVAFAGASPPPQDLTTIRVGLMPILSGSSVAMVTPPIQADAQGTFTINGVTPGRYKVTTTIPAATVPAGTKPPAAWALQSATTKGREALDSGLEVRPNENVTDLALAFTDRPTMLAGTLQDAGGRPASDYFIICYASTPAFLTPPSRRVAMTRPASDGKFNIRNLPPGEYLLAAVTDIEQGEWMDPAFLAQLIPASIKITLVEGDTKTQDIRIAGGV